ncbi:MAG: type II toxin-antitoxin system VapC family toxin [Bacteroidales bacterium]|nr:type II toxin-antitoxin system VapC family toxin [Bacteroidales bacterium]
MPIRYLLDTNICIELLKNTHNVRQRIIEKGVKNCYVSEITLAELYFGAFNSNNAKERIKDVDFIAEHFETVPVFNSLSLYGKMKALLRRQGNPIDDFDILIGTTAIANDMIMVTDNTKHLSRLEGIKLENWVERQPL